ncbi:hypothetical protein BJX65DRAFT_54466 [Aspergillus insuetus]
MQCKLTRHAVPGRGSGFPLSTSITGSSASLCNYLRTRTLSRGHELVLPEACFFVLLSIGCASIPVSDLDFEAIWLRYLSNVST